MSSVKWDIFLETFKSKFVFPTGLVQTIIIGLAVIFFIVFMLNIVLKLQSNDTEKRANAYKAIIPLVLGFFIMAGSVVISGALKSTAESLKYTQSEVENDAEELPEEQIVVDEGNFLVKLIGNGLIGIVDTAIDVANNVLGIEDFDQLFYAQDTKEDGSQTTNALAPFSDNEWKAIQTVYRGFFIVATSIFFIMVAMTGFSMMKSSSQMNPREDAYKDLERWFFVLVILAVGPLAVRAMLEILNSMSGTLYNITETVRPGALKFTSKEMTTGNFVLTGLLKLYYAYILFKINILFIIRKIMLTLLIPIMPIYAVVLGIKKDTSAFDIYLGELVSNILTGFVYSLVFMLIVLLTNFGTPQGGLIVDLIILTVAFEIAKVIRNSFQNIFTRAGGMDEERMAGGFAKTGLMAGMFAGKKARDALFGSGKGGNSGTRTTQQTQSEYGGDGVGGRVGSGSQATWEDAKGNRKDPFSASANPQDSFDDTHSKSYGEFDGMGSHAPTGDALKTNQDRIMMQGARDSAYNDNFMGRYTGMVSRSRLAQKGGMVGGITRSGMSIKAHLGASKDVKNKLAEEKFGVGFNNLVKEQKDEVNQSFRTLRNGTYKPKPGTNGSIRANSGQNTANGVIEKSATKKDVLMDNMLMVGRAFSGNTRGMQHQLDKHHIGHKLDTDVGRGTYKQVKTDYMKDQKKEQQEFQFNKRQEEMKKSKEQEKLEREREKLTQDEINYETARYAEENYDPNYYQPVDDE